MSITLTKDDMKVLTQVVDRAIIRFIAQANPNPVALEVLNMLRQEYDTIDQIVPEIV